MMIYPASSPILKDARLWLYYSGFTVPHNTSALDHDGSIGLATLREDGFCFPGCNQPRIHPDPTLYLEWGSTQN